MARSFTGMELTGSNMSSNIFSPGPRPSESLTNPTEHIFNGGGGYLPLWCSKCGIEDYPQDCVQTTYCEDVEWGRKQFAFLREEARLVAARKHEATEDAVRFARTLLTAEQWELLGIKVAPYRDRDRIEV